MEAIKKRGCADDVCVNDLEAPAFSELPELLDLKNRLKAAGEKEGKVTAVFMSGSGSTIVQVGDDAAPAFVTKTPTCSKRRRG
jgi:4-diphosphocytidyl-2-C-methyl-D-erythritol kinase